MKAKHFHKLRTSADYYDVEVTTNMFGDFDHRWDMTVLARNHQEAAIRARKRGLGICRHHVGTERSTEQFAEYRVKLHKKPDNPRYIHYY